MNPDAALILAYKETGSVWKAGRKIGRSGQSVHKRLKQLGLTMEGGGRKWTARDDCVLHENYQKFADDGQLEEFASALGRTKQFICRKARGLGLTNQNRAKPKEFGPWKNLTEEEAYGWLDKFVDSKQKLVRFMKAHGLGVCWRWAMEELIPAEMDSAIELAGGSSMYRRGRAFEYAAKKVLEKHDYFVMRAPQSRGDADLIAIREGEILAVNCKLLIVQCPPADWNRTFDLAKKIHATPLMAGRWPRKRGVAFMRMVERKDGTHRPQPWVEWEPEKSGIVNDDSQVSFLNAEKVE